MFSVRSMMPDDLPAVLEIQSACYPAHLHESAEALLAKVQNFPSSCYLVEKAGKAVNAVHLRKIWPSPRLSPENGGGSRSLFSGSFPCSHAGECEVALRDAVYPWLPSPASGRGGGGEGDWRLSERYYGKAVAYLFAHEWAGHLPPAFDAPLAICDGRPYFYLHDLAVHPGQRGAGLGEQLWLAARRSAQNAGYAEIRLIAVAGAQLFWQRHGFTPLKDDLPGLAAKLREYGGEASLMRYRF